MLVTAPGTALGVQSGKISDSQLSASSHDGSHVAAHGRLQHPDYWCPANGDPTPWIQVDLGAVKSVSAIATSGTVSSYTVSSSIDKRIWTTVLSANVVFNSKGTSIEILPHIISARYIVIYPQAFASYPGALRLEVYTASPETKIRLPCWCCPLYSLRFNQWAAEKLSCEHFKMSQQIEHQGGCAAIEVSSKSLSAPHVQSMA